MTGKSCPFMSRTIALTHPDDVREMYASFQDVGCLEDRCAAWVPEVTIDMSPIKANPTFADMALKLVQNLAPLGVTTDGNNITVKAHCVLLEPRK